MSSAISRSRLVTGSGRAAALMAGVAAPPHSSARRSARAADSMLARRSPALSCSGAACAAASAAESSKPASSSSAAHGIERRGVGRGDRRGVAGRRSPTTPALDLAAHGGEPLRDGAVAEPRRVVQRLGLDGVLARCLGVVGRCSRPIRWRGVPYPWRPRPTPWRVVRCRLVQGDMMLRCALRRRPAPARLRPAFPVRHRPSRATAVPAVARAAGLRPTAPRAPARSTRWPRGSCRGGWRRDPMVILAIAHARNWPAEEKLGVVGGPLVCQIQFAGVGQGQHVAVAHHHPDHAVGGLLLGAAPGGDRLEVATAARDRHGQSGGERRRTRSPASGREGRPARPRPAAMPSSIWFSCTAIIALDALTTSFRPDAAPVHCSNAMTSWARAISPTDQNRMDTRGMPHSTSCSSSRPSGSNRASTWSASTGWPCHSSARDSSSAACKPPSRVEGRPGDAFAQRQVRQEDGVLGRGDEKAGIDGPGRCRWTAVPSGSGWPPNPAHGSRSTCTTRPFNLRSAALPTRLRTTSPTRGG